MLRQGDSQQQKRSRKPEAAQLPGTPDRAGVRDKNLSMALCARVKEALMLQKAGLEEDARAVFEETIAADNFPEASKKAVYWVARAKFEEDVGNIDGCMKVFEQGLRETRPEPGSLLPCGGAGSGVGASGGGSASQGQHRQQQWEQMTVLQAFTNFVKRLNLTSVDPEHVLRALTAQAEAEAAPPSATAAWLASEAESAELRAVVATPSRAALEFNGTSAEDGAMQDSDSDGDSDGDSDSNTDHNTTVAGLAPESAPLASPPTPDSAPQAPPASPEPSPAPPRTPQSGPRSGPRSRTSAQRRSSLDAAGDPQASATLDADVAPVTPTSARRRSARHAGKLQSDVGSPGAGLRTPSSGTRVASPGGSPLGSPLAVTPVTPVTPTSSRRSSARRAQRVLPKAVSVAGSRERDTVEREEEGEQQAVPRQQGEGVKSPSAKRQSSRRSGAGTLPAPVTAATAVVACKSPGRPPRATRTPTAARTPTSTSKVQAHRRREEEDVGEHEEDVVELDAASYFRWEELQGLDHTGSYVAVEEVKVPRREAARLGNPMAMSPVRRSHRTTDADEAIVMHGAVGLPGPLVAAASPSSAAAEDATTVPVAATAAATRAAASVAAMATAAAPASAAPVVTFSCPSVPFRENKALEVRVKSEQEAGPRIVAAFHAPPPPSLAALGGIAGATPLRRAVGMLACGMPPMTPATCQPFTMRKATSAYRSMGTVGMSVRHAGERPLELEEDPAVMHQLLFGDDE